MRIISLMASLVVLSACGFPITEATERAWQNNFRESLVSGYSDFEGLDVDGDTGYYVFRYRLPGAIDPSQTVPVLRDQIASGKPCFKSLLETATELQMRCRIQTLGEIGFDEYRVLVDPGERWVTVMFGNFDSAAEQRQYELFLGDFRAIHRKGGNSR